MNSGKYNRQISFFGIDGQKHLESLSVTIVGVGGLGTHVIQQLAYLGIKKFSLIDYETVEISNLNRYVGAKTSDLNQTKVFVAKRIIQEINSSAEVAVLNKNLISNEAFQEIIQADSVFGCLDNDGGRVILNELCQAYKVPYFDLATEIFPHSTTSYGGRIFITIDETGCIDCYDLIDRELATFELENSDAQQDIKDIYGLSNIGYNESGPSVISINGTIASLAVTEFLVWATGLRKPQKYLLYRAEQSIVTINQERVNPDCYYCNEIRGAKDNSGVFEYIR